MLDVPKAWYQQLLRNSSNLRATYVRDSLAMGQMRNLHIMTCIPKLRQMSVHAWAEKKSQQKSEVPIHVSVTPLRLLPK